MYIYMYMEYFPSSLILLALVAISATTSQIIMINYQIFMLTCQIFIIPLTLIDNQGHELEEAFIVHGDSWPDNSLKICTYL